MFTIDFCFGKKIRNPSVKAIITYAKIDMSQHAGFFAPPCNEAYINLSANGFKYIPTERKLINKIIKTIKHEALHGAIYDCNVDTDIFGEERIVHKICNQRFPVSVYKEFIKNNSKGEK